MRIAVEEFVPLTGKAFLVDHQERVFSNLLNNEFDCANSPYVIEISDVNFITDFELVDKLEVGLPLLELVCLFLPYVLEVAIPALLDELRVHVVNSEAGKCWFVTNYDAFLTTKIANEASLKR